MHLVYVTASLPFGAGETFVIPEIRELQRRGHRVTVVPVRPRGKIVHDDAGLLAGATVAQPLLSPFVLWRALLQIAYAPLAVFRAAFSLRTSRSLRVLVKNLAVLPKGLWLANVVRQLCVDHIHAEFASTAATAALIASSCSERPWSFSAHRWDISENNLLARKLADASFVRAIDVRGAEELKRLTGPQEKIRVIHLGVALPPAPINANADGPLRVLMGARIDNELKGHRHALEAVARLKDIGVDVALDCAGDGRMRARFEKYARALGVEERVRFLGLVDHQSLLAQMRDRSWDVAILLSLETTTHREGIPAFLIEAMAAGIPVVATRTGSIPELVGPDGILIPQHDSAALAAALAQLAADRRFLSAVGNAGRCRVSNLFSVESTVPALIRLMEHASEAKRRAT
jgi:glycosyltransferase involved in cell wall biosynthesis